jgi:hypothetical protein
VPLRPDTTAVQSAAAVTFEHRQTCEPPATAETQQLYVPAQLGVPPAVGAQLQAPLDSTQVQPLPEPPAPVLPPLPVVPPAPVVPPVPVVLTQSGTVSRHASAAAQSCMARQL